MNNSDCPNLECLSSTMRAQSTHLLVTSTHLIRPLLLHFVLLRTERFGWAEEQAGLVNKHNYLCFHNYLWDNLLQHPLPSAASQGGGMGKGLLHPQS